MDERPTFLVVDDAPLFRELESHFLARYGRVITAESGGEALERVRTDHPDVVVLDMTLPDLDGSLVCCEIRSDAATRETPVVVVGCGDAAEHARAIHAGASDVLMKPLSRRELIGAVRRFVASDRPTGLPRVPLDTPVRVESDGEGRLALCRNLSRGGMFLETKFEPQTDEVRLSFQLPECGTGRLATSARIVWRRPAAPGVHPGMGVRFLALDRDCAQELDAFVHERYVPAAPAAEAGGAAL